MDMLGLHELKLSDSRPPGFIAKAPASLIDRIRDHGAIEPVVVRPLPAGGYEILSNTDTWIAAGELKLTNVPVIIRDDLDDDEAAQIVQDHYVLRHRNPIDEARYFEARLERFGGQKSRGAISKLAFHLNRPRPYIAHSLRLLKLPGQIRDMIATGVLSAGQARPLVSVNDRSLQLSLAKKIAADELSARQAEALAKSAKSGDTEIAPAVSGAPATTQSKSPDILRLERLVSQAIGTQFLLEGDRAVINFFGDYEVLEGILEKLGVRL